MAPWMPTQRFSTTASRCCAIESNFHLLGGAIPPVAGHARSETNVLDNAMITEPPVEENPAHQQELLYAVWAAGGVPIGVSDVVGRARPSMFRIFSVLNSGPSAPWSQTTRRPQMKHVSWALPLPGAPMQELVTHLTRSFPIGLEPNGNAPNGPSCYEKKNVPACTWNGAGR